jgi:hypothetical protein
MRLPLHHAALLPALLLLPQTLRAETRTLPCRLPADARLLFTFEQHGWGNDGMPWHLGLTRRLHVKRQDLGFVLVIDPARAIGKVDDALERRMAAVYDPNDQRVMTVRLDATGRLLAIDDLATHWQAHLARFQRLVQSLAADGAATQRAQAAFASLSRADDATKLRLLASDVVGPWLRLCGQSAVLEPAADGTLKTTEATDSAVLRDSAQYRVDGASGLMRSIERSVTPTAQPERPQRTIWRFDPIPQ